MTHFRMAALAAAVALAPLTVSADTSHGYRAAQAAEGMLVLASTEVAPVASPVRSRAQLGTPRLVRLDGNLVWMDEVVMRAQITAGAYRVIRGPSASVMSLPASF